MNEQEYQKLMYRDYSMYAVFPMTGEVRISSMDPAFADDKKVDFNELMSTWLVELIGSLTIYGFEDCQIYWCHERTKGEYFGGAELHSMKELVDFYHWWMDNEY